MRGDATLPAALVYAFLLVLARVTGAVLFVPIPGASSSPAPARVILALALAVALYPFWPAIQGDPGPALLAGWMLSEAAFGITIGLVAGFLAEAFLFFGQLVGLQAGYSYASTVDPSTHADAGLLLVLAQLLAGLLFFAMGLHRQILLVFARSFQAHPAGAFLPSHAAVDAVIGLGSGIFSTGLRLALPVIALLAMVDIALSLLNRINAQLQVLSLAFPAKMLAAIALVAAMAALFPRVYGRYGSELFGALPALGGR